MQSLAERNITFPELRNKLQELNARQVNTVKAATDLTVTDSGLIGVTEQIPGSDDKLTSYYEPNDVFTGQLADTFKTGLPLTRRLFAERPDVAADLFNGLMHGRSADYLHDDPRTGEISYAPTYEPDSRSFLFRGYTEGEGPAVARALLSSKYRIIDNFEVMTAVLEGMSAVPNLGGRVTVTSADLTDRHMFVNFMAPQIAVNASALLQQYRSPFDAGAGITRAGGFQDLNRVAEMMNRYGGDGQTLYAGFKLKNSETGDGKFKIVPYAKFRVCMNGLAIEADGIDQMHSGVRLDEGTIDWSTATQRKQLELIQSMTQDAVSQFLSADYWTEQIDRLADKAAKPLGYGSKAHAKIEQVTKALNFSKDEFESVWDHFMIGGQTSVAGVMNAVTSVAQTVEDAERADRLEAAAVKVLDLF
jgi:hypothetical protein